MVIVASEEKWTNRFCCIYRKEGIKIEKLGPPDSATEIKIGKLGPPDKEKS